MARDLNKVQITGHLGADPDMRYLPTGKAVTTFSVAVNRTYTKDGEQVNECEWFRVVAWDKLAETANQYLTKGAHVYCEGRLQSRKWEDKDGNERTTVEIVLQEMIFLSGKNADASADSEDGADAPQKPAQRPTGASGMPRPRSAPPARTRPRNVATEMTDDDLPF